MVATKSLPSQDELNALLRYEPDTGKLFWRKRTPSMFSDSYISRESKCARWNGGHAGKEAFVTVRNGYLMAMIGGPRLAHRVIWKMMTGEDPVQIDHIDGVRTNNVWSNLRNVTSLENHQNIARQRRNGSGTIGVFWFRQTKRWRAYGTVNKKRHYLGYFLQKEDAIAARLAWQAEHGFHANHGREAA